MLPRTIVLNFSLKPLLGAGRLASPHVSYSSVVGALERILQEGIRIGTADTAPGVDDDLATLLAQAGEAVEPGIALNQTDEFTPALTQRLDAG